MKKNLLSILCLLLCTAAAAQRPGVREIRTSGDILATGIPVSAMVVSLIKKDFSGSGQLILTGASALAITQILKFSVGKQRPDGSDFRSFPSGHTSSAFVGAAFLQRRYGWHVGIPAYVLAGYTGFTRIYANKHDIWDVGAGAVIGTGCAYLFTKPFAKKHQLVLTPAVSHGHSGIYASMVF